MKIGILTSGNDMLALFSFLQRSSHQYHVWYDDSFSFWGDKSLDLVMDRVAQGIQFLQAKGVGVFLVPPVVELKIRSEGLFAGVKILPLFSTYVQKYCFANSLVGKIGFVGDYLDMQEGQHQLKILAQNYVLSENQSNIKKFHFPFVWWGKEVRNWKYLLDTCAWSMPLVHHLVKQDLRYLKDAGVDMLIPCNYAYFLVQKVIKKSCYTNMRFYGMEFLEQVFGELISGFEVSQYAVSVYYTGHGEFLTQQKKLHWLLSKGKNIDVVYEKIS